MEVISTIWKATLLWEDEQTIEVPLGAEMLCAHTQSGKPTVWFRCDPRAARVFRTILIRGTGHPLTVAEARYIGTVMMDGGRLVFHVFEKLGG